MVEYGNASNYTELKHLNHHSFGVILKYFLFGTFLIRILF